VGQEPDVAGLGTEVPLLQIILSRRFSVVNLRTDGIGSVRSWIHRSADATAIPSDIVMHDRDSKFTSSFDAALKSTKFRVHKAAFRSPDTCAFVERFIQTMRQECLDYFVVFGKRHLNHLVTSFVEHYHEERPHQSLDNDLLVKKPKKPPRSRPTSATSTPLSSISCRCGSAAC
jgi:putative transposase